MLESVLQALGPLGIEIASFILSPCLIFVVTFFVCKLFKKNRFILKGVLVGGILSIVLLIFLWPPFLTDIQGGHAYLFVGFTFFVLGQPLSWIAILLAGLAKGTYGPMVIFSISFLLDWCGLGAFSGWLIQRTKDRGGRKGLKEK